MFELRAFLVGAVFFLVLAQSSPSIGENEGNELKNFFAYPHRINYPADVPLYEPGTVYLDKVGAITKIENTFPICEYSKGYISGWQSCCEKIVEHGRFMLDGKNRGFHPWEIQTNERYYVNGIKHGYTDCLKKLKLLVNKGVNDEVIIDDAREIMRLAKPQK